MKLYKEFFNLKLSPNIKNIYINESMHSMDELVDSISEDCKDLIERYLNIAKKDILECYAQLKANQRELNFIIDSKKEVNNLYENANGKALKNKNNDLMNKIKDAQQIFTKFDYILNDANIAFSTLDFIDHVKSTYSLLNAETEKYIKVLDRSNTEFADALKKDSRLEKTFENFYMESKKVVSEKETIPAKYITVDTNKKYDYIKKLNQKLSGVFSNKEGLNKAVDFIDAVTKAKAMFTKSIKEALNVLDKSSIEFVDKLNKNVNLDREVNSFYKELSNLKVLRDNVDAKLVPSLTLTDYNELEIVYNSLAVVFSHKKEFNKVINLENAISQYFITYKNQIAEYEALYKSSKREFFAQYLKAGSNKVTLIEQTKTLLKSCDSKSLAAIEKDKKDKIVVLKQNYESINKYLAEKDNAILGFDLEKQINNEFNKLLNDVEKVRSSYFADKAKVLNGAPIKINSLEVSTIKTKISKFKAKITKEAKPFIDNMEILDQLDEAIKFVEELVKMQTYAKFYTKYHNSKKDTYAVREFRNLDVKYKNEKFQHSFIYEKEWNNFRKEFDKAAKSNNRKAKVSSFFGGIAKVFTAPFKLFSSIKDGEYKFISILTTILGTVGLALLFVFARNIFTLPTLIITSAAFVFTSIFAIINGFKNEYDDCIPLFVASIIYQLMSFSLLILGILKIGLYPQIVVGTIFSLTSIPFAFELGSLSSSLETKCVACRILTVVSRLIYTAFVLLIFYLIKELNLGNIYYLCLYGMLVIVELSKLIRQIILRKNLLIKRVIFSFLASIFVILPFMIYAFSVSQNNPSLINVGYFALALGLLSYILSFIGKKRRSTYRSSSSSSKKSISLDGSFSIVLPFIIGEVLAVIIFAILFSKLLPYNHDDHLVMTTITFVVTSILCGVGLKRNFDDFEKPYLMLNSFYPLFMLTMLLNPILRLDVVTTVFMSFSYIILASLFVFEYYYLENGHRLFFLLQIIFTLLIAIGDLIIKADSGDNTVLRVFYYIATAISELYLILTIFWQKEEDFDNLLSLFLGFGGIAVFLFSFVSFVFGGFYIFLGLLGIIVGISLCIASICKYDF